jgi:hypothetical protein
VSNIILFKLFRYCLKFSSDKFSQKGSCEDLYLKMFIMVIVTLPTSYVLNKERLARGF